MALKGIIKVKSSSVAAVGDLVCLDGQELDISINEKDRKVLGIAIEPRMQPTDADVPLMDIFGGEYFLVNPLTDPEFAVVMVEGFCPLAKVCDEDGAVTAGDLLVSANKDGFLKKQTSDGSTYDGVVRDYTVARAIEDVTFDGSGEAVNVNVYLIK